MSPRYDSLSEGKSTHLVRVSPAPGDLSGSIRTPGALSQHTPNTWTIPPLLENTYHFPIFSLSRPAGIPTLGGKPRASASGMLGTSSSGLLDEVLNELGTSQGQLAPGVAVHGTVKLGKESKQESQATFESQSTVSLSVSGP